MNGVRSPRLLPAARGPICSLDRPYAHTPNKVKNFAETWRENVLCSGYVDTAARRDAAHAHPLSAPWDSRQRPARDSAAQPP